MTKELIKKNWKTGRNEPKVFLGNFVRDKKGKLLDLDAVKAQKELFEVYQSGDYSQIYMGGGNSGGKTFGLAMLGAWASAWKTYPKPRSFKTAQDFLREPYGVLCTAAEQKHSNELWEEILGMYERSPYLSTLISSVKSSSRLHPHPKIQLKNGASIDSIGLHEKGKHVVTGDYSLILINEIGEVNHLRYILDNVLTQRTWRRGGIIVGAGTPRGGQQSQLWEVFRRGLELNNDGSPNKYHDPRVHSHYADARQNPFAEQEVIEEFVSTRNDRLIDERVRGHFVGVEGAAFPAHLLDDIFDEKLPFKTKSHPKMDIIHGLDFGRKQDYTVCVTLDVRKKPWKGLNIYRKGGGYGTWEEILNDIKHIHNEYGGEFVADTTASSGDIQGEWLADLDLPFLPMNFSSSPSRKVNLINFLQRTVGKQEVVVPGLWDVVRDEMMNYPANMEDKGIMTDCVIALGLACWGGEYYGNMEAPVDITP